ncbi:DUF2339 domain-containing protein [Pseudolabrys taiwanensis]|uniref:DUF2339 domain-containing protein n=1 Tax=Pseudolabrys taiwanensis TaxID=331696 RepID=A0A346A2L9_9HYPH|nr:DUF2339 domain-containing protein [Pseudolabrys taiwanensis]AXK83416.1 DUF2339 domain-containing protein [Pseudolabrys taiwanensis]
MEIVLLVLLVLAFPVIAIVALVMTLNAREEVRALQRRVAALEAAGPAAAAPATATPVEPVVVAEPAPAIEEVRPEPPAAPQPAPAPPVVAPARATATLEERFGTQWVVWVGGIALALGGIFLVRYSIEEGLLGPGVRIFLAALFAAALIAAGEWTRRHEAARNISAIPSRHIPSILTAAGTVAAYATVYAAFALYNFLSPAAAFILLGIVALATLAAALLHGPALAGLGLAGAFLTPALVASDEPSYWALYLYLTVVTAAAFALARMRLWRWLAITAVVLGFLWTLVGIDYPEVEALGAHLFFAVAGFALAAVLIVSGLSLGPAAATDEIDPISSGAIGAYLLAAALLVLGSSHAPSALVVFTLLTATTIAITWRAPAALYALPGAAIVTIVVMLHWAAPALLESLVLPGGVTAGAVPEPATGSGRHLALGALFAIMFGASGFAAQDRSKSTRAALFWSVSAVITPIAILIALYLRIAEFDRSIPFAGGALLLAALFGYATDLLSKRAPRAGLVASEAVFAAGAVASLALTLTFALDKGWLTVGLALMVPGIAWISRERPLPALRYLAAAVIVLVLLRIAYEPRIVGDDIGTTPLFNWLLYGYGVPAASFWTAGYLLRQRADDIPARMADSAAILFTVLLAFLEIRHYMNNGDVFHDSTALAEVALQICTGLAMAIGLERLRGRTDNIVHNVGALIIVALTFAAIVLGPGLFLNPMMTDMPVGSGVFFNLILLAYGIPAILAAVLALMARTTRPIAYRAVAAATAVALSIGYLSLEVRALYHGPELWRGVTTDLEQYTYSAVWLIFGVVLLIAGLLMRSQPARLASAAVIALTVAKVFLADMADLTGIFRALSFIGLGVVLVAIGWLYQRLLFPARATAPPDTTPQAPA